MTSLTLITGATGFLGGAVVAKLLTTSTPSSLLLLVRGVNEEQGLKRVRAHLRRFGLRDAQLAAIGREQILPGDITDVSAFGHDPRIAKVTSVVNCAAVTSFANNPLIRPVNVTGTLAFARQMAAASRLVRFVHVSTAMACGAQAGPVIDEDYAAPAQTRHLVPYTESKSEVEHQLRAQGSALPLLIVRPSIIVGHSRDGCQASSSIFWVFRLAQMLGKFTYELDDRIDVIPVDYGASAIVHLLQKADLAHDTYHISAGEQRAASFREIDMAMAEGFGHPPLADDYRRASVTEIQRSALRLTGHFSPGMWRLLLKAIRLYGAFAELDIRFKNQRLLGEGMALPPSFASYAAVCARSCRDLSLAEQMMIDFN